MIKRVSYGLRSQVKDHATYDRWLATIEDGDQVLVQTFHPANDGILDLPLEFWVYSIGRVQGERVIYDNDSHPLNREKGWQCWYNDPVNPWGNVFPSRIVPFSASLGREEGETLANSPIFEPNYLGCERLVFLVEHGKGFHKTGAFLGRFFAYSYKVAEVEDGYLYNAFVPYGFDLEPFYAQEGRLAKLLYRQALPRE